MLILSAIPLCASCGPRSLRERVPYELCGCILEIIEFIEFLQHEDTVVDGHGSRIVEFPWKLTGEDFLDFAVRDLDTSEDDPRNVVNALSNAKRALHCQVDSVLYALGFHACPSKVPRNFPGKLELIRELGVVTPRVLAKINSARNLMEHEYSLPQAGEVMDFVDIVGLFLAATSRLAYTSPDICDFGYVDLDKQDSYPSAEVKLDAEHGRLEIAYWTLKDGERQMKEAELTCESPEYSEVIKAMVVGIRYR